MSVPGPPPPRRRRPPPPNARQRPDDRRPTRSRSRELLEDETDETDHRPGQVQASKAPMIVMAVVAVAVLAVVLLVVMSGGEPDNPTADTDTDGPATEPREADPEPEPQALTFRECVRQDCVVVGLLDGGSYMDPQRRGVTYTHTVSTTDAPLRTVADLREHGSRDSLGQLVKRLEAATAKAGTSGSGSARLSNMGLLVVATDDAPVQAFVNLLMVCANPSMDIRIGHIWLAFDDGDLGIHAVETFLPEGRVGNDSVRIKQQVLPGGVGFQIVPEPLDDVFSIIRWSGTDGVYEMMAELERMFRKGYPARQKIELDITDERLRIGMFRPLLLRLARIQSAVPRADRAWLTFKAARPH